MLSRLHCMRAHCVFGDGEYSTVESREGCHVLSLYKAVSVAGAVDMYAMCQSANSTVNQRILLLA